MTGVVVFTNVFQVAGICHARNLINVARPAPQIGIFVNVFLVALEMRVINVIETENGRKQAEIRQSQLVSRKIPLLSQRTLVHPLIAKPLSSEPSVPIK